MKHYGQQCWLVLMGLKQKQRWWCGGGWCVHQWHWQTRYTEKILEKIAARRMANGVGVQSFYVDSDMKKGQQHGKCDERESDPMKEKHTRTSVWIRRKSSRLNLHQSFTSLLFRALWSKCFWYCMWRPDWSERHCCIMRTWSILYWGHTILHSKTTVMSKWNSLTDENHVLDPFIVSHNVIFLCFGGRHNQNNKKTISSGWLTQIEHVIV